MFRNKRHKGNGNFSCPRPNFLCACVVEVVGCEIKGGSLLTNSLIGELVVIDGVAVFELLAKGTVSGDASSQAQELPLIAVLLLCCHGEGCGRHTCV